MEEDFSPAVCSEIDFSLTITAKRAAETVTETAEIVTLFGLFWDTVVPCARVRSLNFTAGRVSCARADDNSQGRVRGIGGALFHPGRRGSHVAGAADERAQRKRLRETARLRLCGDRFGGFHFSADLRR